jgi:hypothetical protein
VPNQALLLHDEEVVVEEASADLAEEQAGHLADPVLPSVPLAAGAPSTAADNDVVGPSAQVLPPPQVNLGMPRPPALLQTAQASRPPAAQRQQVTFDQHSAEEDFGHPRLDLHRLKRPTTH